MSSWRAAGFSLAALIFFGDEIRPQATLQFGNPISIENARTLKPPRPVYLEEYLTAISSQRAIGPILGGPVEVTADTKDETPVPKKPNTPSPLGSKQGLTDEFGLMPPNRDQLFRLQSEDSLKERFRQELPKVKKVDFPNEASRLPETPEADAAPFPRQIISPIAPAICYRPLYFEDKRTERFGQYVPCVQPLISAGRFYSNSLILPGRLLLTPPWTFQCDNR